MKAYKLDTPVGKSELDLLYYEIRIFNKLFPLGSDFQGIEKNARLDSFLIHARNLIDFLEANKLREDDIVSTDFVDQNDQQIDSMEVVLPKEIKEKINKHLSHITKLRLNEKPSWNIEIITTRINQELSSFIDKISDQYFPTKGERIRDDFNKVIMDYLIKS